MDFLHICLLSCGKKIFSSYRANGCFGEFLKLQRIYFKLHKAVGSVLMHKRGFILDAAYMRVCPEFMRFTDLSKSAARQQT